MIVALLLLLQATPSTGPSPAVSRWSVGYGDSSCTLSRTFSTPIETIKVIIEPDPAMQQGELFLILPGPAKHSIDGEATLTTTPSGVPYTARYVGLPVSDQFHAGRLYLDRDSWKMLTGAEKVQVTGPDAVEISIPLQDLGEAIPATKACLDGLLRQWGADPAATVTEASIPRSGTLFISGDYPESAIRADEQGIVKAIAEIDGSGRATSCRVVASSGSATLDKATCKIIVQRVQLPPSPVAIRYFYKRTVWILPH